MYRQFVETSLSQHELKATNKYAPDGLKFCNGICKDYRDATLFRLTKKGAHGVCQTCSNVFILAKKRIDEGKITLEQFKENPQVIEDAEAPAVTITSLCGVCQHNKPVTHFEGNRNTCKACRSLSALKKNADVESQIADIETLKTNLPHLENYIRRIPKDKLVHIIAHFKVGRQATDSKDRMINNVMGYFKRIQDPFICLGTCGFRLEKEFDRCEGCQPKSRKRNPQIMVDFEDNLQETIDNLLEITDADEARFNKKQIILIYNGLKITPCVGLQNKEGLIEGINKHLKKRAEKPQLNVPVGKNRIQLNDIAITSREDGFVNATELCKAGGKLFGDWKRLDSTKELIKVLGNDMGCHISQLVDVKKGNSSSFSQGSWIHPDLAVQLAQWISPSFALQVSRWIRELAMSGMVSLQREKIAALESEVEQGKLYLSAAENKHSAILRRREIHKFKKGPVFYVLCDTDSTRKRYKVGIDDIDVNVRLAQHRTTSPYIRVEMVMYTAKNRLIEEAMLERYTEYRKPFSNHEWIHNIDLEHILSSVQTFVQFLSIDHTLGDSIEAYNQVMEPKDGE
jgi:hypothetical protein